MDVGVSKIIQNYVTSFMDDPFEQFVMKTANSKKHL